MQVKCQKSCCIVHFDMPDANEFNLLGQLPPVRWHAIVHCWWFVSCLLACVLSLLACLLDDWVGWLVGRAGFGCWFLWMLLLTVLLLLPSVLLLLICCCRRE